jgi:hypothetical protein
MVLGADGLQRRRLPLAGGPGGGARVPAPRSPGPRARGLGVRLLPDLFGAALQDTLVCLADRPAGFSAGRLGGGRLSLAARTRRGARRCGSPRWSASRRRSRPPPGFWSAASRTFAIATTIRRAPTCITTRSAASSRCSRISSAWPMRRPARTAAAPGS